MTRIGHDLDCIGNRHDSARGSHGQSAHTRIALAIDTALYTPDARSSCEAVTFHRRKNHDQPRPGSKLDRPPGTPETTVYERRSSAGTERESPICQSVYFC